MLELIKIIKEVEQKHGVMVRIHIGLSDDGESLIIRDTMDCSTEKAFYNPAEGGAIINLFDDGEESARMRIDAVYRAMRRSFDEFFKQNGDDKLQNGSIGKWGFCEKLFFTRNPDVEYFNSKKWYGKNEKKGDIT